MKRLILLVAFLAAASAAVQAVPVQAADSQPAPAASAAPIVQGPEDAKTTAAVRGVFDAFRKGTFSRAQFTPEVNKTVSDEMLARAAHEFGQSDPPAWTYLGRSGPGAENSVYRAEFKQYAIVVTTRIDADGRVALMAVVPDKAQR